MKKLTHRFEISYEAWELLLDIKRVKYAEYRDTEYPDLKSFEDREHKSAMHQTVEWFLGRNHNGTYYLIDELCRFDLIDIMDGSWHETYVLTKLGEEIIEQNI